jgi:hypothetical protein
MLALCSAFRFFTRCMESCITKPTEVFYCCHRPARAMQVCINYQDSCFLNTLLDPCVVSCDRLKVVCAFRDLYLIKTYA